MIALLVIIGVVAAVSLISGTVAAVSRIATQRNSVSIAIGTLTMPALICLSFGYWALTMEVDDAPPGNVLMGSLTAVAVVTPFALFVSRFTVMFLSRRALQKGS